MKYQYLILTVFISFASCCYAGNDNLVTISANGIRTTYALTTMRNVTIEDKNVDNPKFKVAFNDGTSSVGNLRAVAIERDTYYGDGGVEVKTTDETATITWPVIIGAAYYELIVCKDAECFDALYVLKLDTDGHMVDVIFSNASGSTRSSRSLSYTVTGLSSATTYYYHIVALDSADQELDDQYGTFTTLVTSVNKVDEDKIQFYSNGKRIVVDSAQSHNIMFYNISGVQLGECVVASHCECIVSISGVYIVSVDGKRYKVRIN